MQRNKQISVKSLKLDLKNFRALPQTNEIEAIRSLYSAAPDWYEALLVAIAEEGYLSLEEIGVLKEGNQKIVLEGNRRVSIFKILLGIIPLRKLNIPFKASTIEKIESITEEWKLQNSKIPCMVFEDAEEPLLRRIVRRTHGNDDLAGRKPWESISKARESRDVQKIPVPELDLLERILEVGHHHNEENAKKWRSNFKFTVFYEVIRKFCTNWKISLSDLRDRYATNDLPAPTMDVLERVVADIGNGLIAYKQIRQTSFYEGYDLSPLPTVPGSALIGHDPKPTESHALNNEKGNSSTAQSANTKELQGGQPQEKKTLSTTSSPTSTHSRTILPGTIRHSAGLIKEINPTGFKSKDKLAVILREMQKVNNDETPNAFGILMRTLIDLSVTEFCETNQLKLKKDILIEKIKTAHAYILNMSSNRAATERELTTAFNALMDPTSAVSTALLNVITHRRNALATPGSLRIGFANIMPFLHALGL